MKIASVRYCVKRVIFLLVMTCFTVSAFTAQRVQCTDDT